MWDTPPHTKLEVCLVWEGSTPRFRSRSHVDTVWLRARGASDHSEREQDYYDQQNEADAAAAVVADSRAHPIAAVSEHQQQHNENDEKHDFVSPLGMAGGVLREAVGQQDSEAAEKVVLDRLYCDVELFARTGDLILPP